MKDYNISIYGDSILKGILFDKDKNKYIISENIAEKVADTLDINIKNHSSFGMNTNKAIGIYNKNINNEKVNAVIFEYGGNDCNFDWEKISQNPQGNHLPVVTLQQFTNNIEFMIVEALKKDIKVILTTLPPISSDRFFDFITRKGLSKTNILNWLGDKEHIYRHHERYNAAVLKLAKKYNLYVADIRDNFLQQKNCNNLLCDDGMHPNSKGQKIIYNTFIDFYNNYIN